MSEDNRSGKAHADERATAEQDLNATLAQQQLAAERQALTADQQQAQQELAALESKLHAIDHEMAALDSKREQYALLAAACEALHKLSQSDSGELFWGEQQAATAPDQLRAAMSRLENFQAEVKRLEDKRLAAREAIEGTHEVLDILDYDLYQSMQQEESLKQQWIVERDATEFPSRRLLMPWVRGLEDDKRFQRSLAACMLAATLLGLLMPLIELPIPERNEIIEVPERFAKLIRKQPEQPPPPPLAAQEELPEEPPEVVPEETVEPPPKLEVAVAAKPKPSSEKVKSVGILAFRENFSNLSETRPAAKLGSQARVSSGGESAVGRPERAMVAAQGSDSSGGINLASISRDVSGGGTGLAEGVSLTRAASSIGGGGPDGRPHSTGAVAGRTDEEIQIVFDRYKAALYRLYNRELRKDPTLRGQMVLTLTIEPDGRVSLCRMQSSDMDSPNLASRVISSVSGFDFGAKDVPAVTIIYPIDFLPTA